MNAQETAERETTQQSSPAAAPAPDKRLASLEAVLDGIKARNLGDAAPKFEQVEHGSKITLMPLNDQNKTKWPSITIGRNGGITINELSSYDGSKEGTLNAAVNGDVLLAKQEARNAAKKAVAEGAKKGPGTVVDTGKETEEKVAA